MPSLYKSITTLDIAKISLAIFYLNLRRPENELFAVSLYELDRKLERRELPDEPANEAEIDQKLPTYLQEYCSAFSKAVSDELPLHRLYDHKIELESDAQLSYGPLYSQSTEEL